MDLSKATNKELYDECRKHKLFILSDSLIELWDNKQDECWNDVKLRIKEK